MDNGITFICTACNRPELLLKTLDSFKKHNTYPIDRYIVYEDSGLKGVNDEVREQHRDVEFISPPKRTGQIIAQDTLWQKVKTEYVLAWEEDWETTEGGFIEQALPILKAKPNILQVIFRDPGNINNHPTIYAGQQYRLLSTQYKWKGFSFAPSLKRLVDYNKIVSYSRHVKFDRKVPWRSEYNLGLLYWKLGYKAACLPKGYVEHIGAGQHVF